MEGWNVWRVFRFLKNSFSKKKVGKKFYRLCDFASKRSNVPYQVFQFKKLDKNPYLEKRKQRFLKTT